MTGINRSQTNIDIHSVYHSIQQNEDIIINIVIEKADNKVKAGQDK
jgi:hypothetical protein